MDVYTLFEVLLIVLAVFICVKKRSRESILLLSFFFISVFSSAIVYFFAHHHKIDLQPHWTVFFSVLILVFGHFSDNGKIKLGYMAHVTALGMELIYSIGILYPISIACAYLFQLWAAYNGNTMVDTRTNNRDQRSFHSSAMDG